MRFYNREIEIAQLQNIRQKSLISAQMTLVIGRRRIGKTSLLKKTFENEEKFLYFFIAKKNEALLCAEFLEEIKLKLNINIYGHITSFKDIFALLIDTSKKQHFTLVIDEFQEFSNINRSVYSEIQNMWDTHKENSKMNLVLCGSVYSMMTKIFEHSKEPLFGRAQHKILVKSFSIETIKEILKDHHKDYSPEDLLAFYTITGGVAKYIELLVNAGAFTYQTIIDEVLKENSLFLDEGKNVLIDEFGKDYANYFSILSLIAASKTSRPEIESILEMNIGGFLDRLETEYDLIQKVLPIYAKPGSRNMKYRIKDHFLNFWFRFIFKYRSAVEIENLDFVKEIVHRDYAAYSGKILEVYFAQKLKEEKKYSKIGTYWEKGNLNEIDIIAENEREKTILFAGVKRNPKNISLQSLEKRAEKLMQKLPDYRFDFQGFSLNDL